MQVTKIPKASGKFWSITLVSELSENFLRGSFQCDILDAMLSVLIQLPIASL